jgi:hypothetical protein
MVLRYAPCPHPFPDIQKPGSVGPRQDILTVQIRAHVISFGCTMVADPASASPKNPSTLCLGIACRNCRKIAQPSSAENARPCKCELQNLLSRDHVSIGQHAMSLGRIATVTPSSLENSPVCRNVSINGPLDCPTFLQALQSSLASVCCFHYFQSCTPQTPAR